MKRTALAAALLIVVTAQAAQAVPVCPPGWATQLVSRIPFIQISCALEDGPPSQARTPGAAEPVDARPHRGQSTDDQDIIPQRGEAVIEDSGQMRLPTRVADPLDG